MAGLLGKDGAFYNTVDEKMQADARWEQQESIKKQLQEQNRIAQQQLQMQQQALEQEMQFREEQERRRRIAEENAEMDKALNQARVYCQSKGVDFDYMLNFYARCYSEKEKTPEIIQIEEEIKKLNDLQEAIDIKNELKDYEKAEKVFLFIILPLLLIIPSFALVSFFQGDLWLGVLEVIIILFLIFINKKILPDAEEREKFNNKRFRRNDIIRKYHIRRFQTKEYYSNKITELKDKLNHQIEQTNIISRKYQKEFDDFRKNHYNKEIELLFKDLQINFNKIEKEEIKAEGTIADYKEFFEDKILEM